MKPVLCENPQLPYPAADGRNHVIGLCVLLTRVTHALAIAGKRREAEWTADGRTATTVN